jgi:opacity protein-like surface antigen
MKRMQTLAWTIGMLALAAAPALAQQAPPPRPTPRPQTQTRPAPPRARTPLGIRAYGLVDLEQMAAKDSFSAVLGSAQMIGFGAGVDVTGLGGTGLFARVAFSTMSKDGERVFVDDTGDAHSLGIPITVKMTPFEFGAGWRFKAMDRRGRYVPYVGAGLLRLGYKETSDFAVDDEDEVSESFTGYTFFGGVDIAASKVVTVAIEGQYRTVPDALGVRGASVAFDETDLGGFNIRFMIGIRK